MGSPRFRMDEIVSVGFFLFDIVRAILRGGFLLRLWVRPLHSIWELRV